MKPNILVCGRTGAGKTSLIQAVTSAGTVPDSAIGHAAPTTAGFQLYETEIANFIDSEGMNPGQTVDEYSKFIMGEVIGRLDAGNANEIINSIWYCIDGSGARVQSADAKLIANFSDKVLLAVTKCDTMRKGQIESMMKELLNLIPADRIVMVSSQKTSGLAQLLAKTENMTKDHMRQVDNELNGFHERWDSYYAGMKRRWEARTNEEADSFINWAAGRAAAIAITPLPLADTAPLMANEVYMIYKLGTVYGYAVNQTVVAMVLGCVGGSLAGQVAASFLPFLKIPIAAGITYGIGKAAKAYFESDMKLNVDELKEKFLEGEQAAKNTNWKENSQEEK